MYHKFQHEKILHSGQRVHWCVLYASNNKQCLYPYTALIECFLTENECVQCALILYICICAREPQNISNIVL